jgi:hypothetical protein
MGQFTEIVMAIANRNLSDAVHGESQKGLIPIGLWRSVTTGQSTLRTLR